MTTKIILLGYALEIAEYLLLRATRALPVGLEDVGVTISMDQGVRGTSLTEVSSMKSGRVNNVQDRCWPVNE